MGLIAGFSDPGAPGQDGTPGQVIHFRLNLCIALNLRIKTIPNSLCLRLSVNARIKSKINLITARRERKVRLDPLIKSNRNYLLSGTEAQGKILGLNSRTK